MAAINLIYNVIHCIPPSGSSKPSVLSFSGSLSHDCFSRNPPKFQKKLHKHSRTRILAASSITAGYVKEFLPPPLDSSSDPPAIFDGIPKLYISYSCPYAQRVWITRNVKGLQDKIKLVPIDLKNRPAWYEEKVYPANKVPALEHNNEVMGESLDLIKYIDRTFEGPSLFPDDTAKRDFGEELLSYIDSFCKSVIASFKEDETSQASAAFDYIEDALTKYGDGPFFLGELSLVDIAYAPFIERFQPFLLEVKNYDITKGRPKLTEWNEAMNKLEAYKETKQDTEELVESYKRRFLERKRHWALSLSSLRLQADAWLQPSLQSLLPVIRNEKESFHEYPVCTKEGDQNMEVHEGAILEAIFRPLGEMEVILRLLGAMEELSTFWRLPISISKAVDLKCMFLKISFSGAADGVETPRLRSRFSPVPPFLAAVATPP